MAVRARPKSGARIATVAVCIAFLVGGLSAGASAAAAPPRSSTASPFVAILGAGFRGYLLVQADGNVIAHGHAHSYGSLPSEGIVPNAPIVAIVPSQGIGGYWLVGADGGVYTFGHAPFYGSLGGTHVQHPVVGLVPTATQKGYLLIDSTGALFGFGDAHLCCGSTTYPAGPPRSAPIVGVNGQFEVASDGSVYTLGGTPGPYGSMAGRHLNAPIVGIEPLGHPCGSPRCDGYWLIASDGGVFSFGDARYLGSMGARHLNQPVVAMSGTYLPPNWLPGYWEVAADGGVFTFGHATFFGSEVAPAGSNPG